jgi:hypothetical protein
LPLFMVARQGDAERYHNPGLQLATCNFVTRGNSENWLLLEPARRSLVGKLHRAGSDAGHVKYNYLRYLDIGSIFTMKPPAPLGIVMT